MTVEIRWRGRLDELDPEARAQLVDRADTIDEEIRRRVSSMHDDIVREGDDALIDYTERFDDVTLDAIEVPRKVWTEALARAPDGFVEAFETAADQVRAYHEALSIRRSPRFAERGIEADERVVPLERAGLYVPGGQAAYPSTVAMTVVPAQVAGVDEVTVASPPDPDGMPHDLVLAACRILDVDRVVALGGAQAVLALAEGTDAVPAHPVVAGPGNAYVQAAKEHVAGRVRIDAPAGPSEVAVLADGSADPGVVARELVAQAEHDTDTLAVALCQGDGTVEAIEDALEDALEGLPREETVRQSLAARGALVTVDHADQALAFLDDLAPEHCAIYHEDADRLADRLTGPACIVHGEQARVPLTDYAAGPSHVLPTGGHARAYGGIDLETFTKRVHVARLDDPDPELVRAAAELARLEGLDGHANALEEGPT